MNYQFAAVVGIVGLLFLFILFSPIFTPIFLTITGGGSDTNKVAVSSNDTNADFLFSKLEAGSNITLSIQNPGANETVQISSTAGGGGSDTNKVAVSSNDTNAGFLFSKLQAGSGITLSIQNPSGDENILISSTGGGGVSYTSGTPDTIEVNNDTNTISQDFDGNFNSRINNLDLNNSLDYSKYNCDGNQSCDINGHIGTSFNAYFDQNVNVDGNVNVQGRVVSNEFGSASGSIDVFTSGNMLLHILGTGIGFQPSGVNVGIAGFEVGTILSNATTVLEIQTTAWPFKVTGLGDTGVFFNGAQGSIDFVFAGTNIYRIFVFGAGSSAFSYNTRATDPNPNALAKGSSFYVRSYTDGNQLLGFNSRQSLYLPVGGWQSDSAPDYNLDRVKVREDLNVGRNLIVDQNISVNHRNNDTPAVKIYTDDANNTYIHALDINGGLSLVASLDEGDLNMFQFYGDNHRALPFLRGNAGVLQSVGIDTTTYEIFRATSASRYKKDIVDLNTVVDLSCFYNLTPKAYKDVNTGTFGAGYLAEEVVNCYPEFGLYNNRGEIEGFDYQSLWSVLANNHLLLEKRLSDLNSTQKLIIQEICLIKPSSQLCPRP